jgi:hypothetical protein
MALADDLERIAAAAAAHGDVSGVLAAEPAAGVRVYLVAFGDDESRRWALFDDTGSIVDRREDVRDAASIVAMAELSAELAGGGARMVERPAGIEEAEEAALALERTIGTPPRVATPAYLDAVGAATLALERALGEPSSPFSSAIRAGTGAVDAFVKDVERGYLVELR